MRLAIIARDEEDRLEALAERLEGIIDSACVLIDDRTTDDTQLLAEALWGELPGGCIIETFPFGDFSQARNLLLARARVGLDRDDYLLLLDPDSLLSGDLPANEELVEPSYGCEWRMHGMRWYRVILLRADTPAIYEGAVHEVINVIGSPMFVIPTVWVDAVVTANEERLEWIAEVLRRDAAENPRSAFYLAQTLRDLQRSDEALGWFLRRAAMGDGWDEETYVATVEAGALMQVLDWEMARTLWHRCLKIRPRRSEAIYRLANQANTLGEHSEALAWASLGLRIGPSSDQLFVNRWIEQEGLLQEFERATISMTGLDLAPAPPDDTTTLEPANG